MRIYFERYFIFWLKRITITRNYLISLHFLIYCRRHWGQRILERTGTYRSQLTVLLQLYCSLLALAWSSFLVMWMAGIVTTYTDVHVECWLWAKRGQWKPLTATLHNPMPSGYVTGKQPLFFFSFSPTVLLTTWFQNTFSEVKRQHLGRNPGEARSYSCSHSLTHVKVNTSSWSGGM